MTDEQRKAFLKAAEETSKRFVFTMDFDIPEDMKFENLPEEDASEFLTGDCDFGSVFNGMKDLLGDKDEDNL